jgi:hypothetical protein
VQVVKRSVPLPLLCHKITYPLLFLLGISGLGGAEICAAYTYSHKITYPLLFLRGTSGVGGEEICAAATHHLPAAVPAWNLWRKR